MRILFISQLFDPEYSIKGLALMKYWVEQGHEVEVITTFPNYPMGKVYENYKLHFKQVENLDGVKIVRLWSYISHSKSKSSRAATYLSFTFMALIYSFISKKPDLLYTYHPQSTTGLIGVLLKKIKGVPFVTDVQDLWPDSLIATGLNKDGVVITLIRRWCSYVYDQAKGVVVLSTGFRDALIERGVEPQKIHIVYNWCPEEDRIDQVLLNSTYKPVEGSPAQLVYAGNIGTAQSLSSLIEAVSELSKSKIELKIYGNGVEKEKLEKHVVEQGYENISFEGYLPPAQIFNVLVQADILAVHLRNEELFKITIPSKTQSSMALNKPLLMAVGGEVNGMVEYAYAGVTAIPESTKSIKNALLEFINKFSEWESMGDNSRKYYDEHFSMLSNYKRIDRLLEEVVQ
jgi:colanic acid biosynthesis glycosyl transferase WcaI